MADRDEDVAQRFGVPPLAVQEIQQRPITDLVARYQAGFLAQPGAELPTVVTRYPLGSAAVMDVGAIDERYVLVLTRFDAHALKLAEPENGIRRHISFDLYRRWAMAGHLPPYVHVNEADNGDLIVCNRRRVLVAQELGRTIDGWLSPVNRETGLPLKVGDIRQALAVPVNTAKSAGMRM